MLTDLLNDDSVLVRVTTAAFIVFAPLYLLANAGYGWAGTLGWLAFASILLANVGKDFKGKIPYMPGTRIMPGG